MPKQAMKWTSWSAHFAWGAGLAMGPVGFKLWGHVIDAPSAMIFSGMCGILWELLYWVCVDTSAKGYPSWVDWAWWAVGASVGGLLMVMKM
jgi:hypothetical protein